MGDRMRRRHFLAALGGAAASWSGAAPARETPARIGFLASGAAASINSAHQIGTIKHGLADNGLAEGRDFAFEARFAAGQYERLPEMAHDLTRSGVSAIIVDAIASARAAQHLVPPVPVIMVSIDDPVGNGLIASLERPGGHTTGTATATAGLTPKILQMQRTILAKAASMAVLYNPANPPSPAFLESFRVRAAAMGASVRSIEFRSREELEAAFRDMAARPPDALHVMMDAATGDLIDRIPALALAHRLPTFATAPEFAGYGGLIGYGASREQLYVRSGYFVKRILDGANPGDLPVEQPSRNELWINLKTTRALDIAMPATLLAAADRLVD